MLGAIIGDIAGSRFEWNNQKTKEFELFASECRLTDDSVMSLAVCDALLSCQGDYSHLSERVIASMQEYGKHYPNAGYGRSFFQWIMTARPKPYNSWGNGAAMRVSGCGFVASSIEEAKSLSKMVTEVTHNHEEGIKGAEAVAVAVYLAKTGSGKQEIREHILQNYYDIGFKLDEIREGYRFDVSCQGSVPQAFEAFFESEGFEDTIRNAISIGGDSDTIAAIAGSVADAFYGIPADLRERAITFLDQKQLDTLTRFERLCPGKTEA